MEETTNPANEDIVNYRGLKAMPFIIGNEAFEKLGSMGTQSNLVVYLTAVFNIKSVTAATFINLFNGTTNFAPLLGAFLSDTYFGRYKTLAFASISSLLGMTVLTLTAAIPKLHPPNCSQTEASSCRGPTPWQLAVLLSGLGLIAIGAGGIRPCCLPFGADQFNPNTESGKKRINSFFNWYYFTFTFAVLISVTIIVYVQSNVSWAIGLSIPAALMLLACVLFFAGTKLYVIVKPGADGSPTTSVVQVLVAAAHKRKLKLPDDPAQSLFNYMPSKSINSKLPYTSQFSFLDKSAIITSDDQIKSKGSAANPWRLCRMQQVEETKCILRAIPLVVSGIIYFVAILTQPTYVVLQGLQSDRRLGNTSFQVPAASLGVFYMLSLTLWIPIYDRILVPWLRKMTGHEGGITQLQRMGIGIILSLLLMLVSGLVEEKRRHMAFIKSVGVTSKGGAISSMSAFWLAPQLALSGLTEAFNSIAQNEFYYKQFPESMRSIAGSFFYFGVAVSSYLTGLLISIVHNISSNTSGGDWLPDDLNRGKLDYLYYLVAVLEVLNFGYFMAFANWYRYKGTGMDSEVAMEPKQQPENQSV